MILSKSPCIPLPVIDLEPTGDRAHGRSMLRPCITLTIIDLEHTGDRAHGRSMLRPYITLTIIDLEHTLACPACLASRTHIPYVIAHLCGLHACRPFPIPSFQ